MTDEEVERLAREVDALVSQVHDYVWPRADGSSNATKQEANDAIWAIHHRLRPLYASQVADEADVRPLRANEETA